MRLAPAAVLGLLLLAILPASGDAPLAEVRVPFPGIPSTLAALPDGRVLAGSLTDGLVFALSPANQLSGPILDLPSSPPDGEYGLLGLAVHPDWPAEPWVYAFYTEPPSVAVLRFQRIVRFAFGPGDTVAGPPQDVVTGLTTGAACCHNGGRIAFGLDRMLHATLGDNMLAPQAQLPLTAAGKVLRYTPEGAIPADNPYPGQPAAVLGMRNPFGLTFDAQWGMVVTDNGPSLFDGPEGADEVNLLAVGDNGGWPLSRGDVCLPVHVCPVWHSGLTHLGPTGVEVPRGSAVPAWDGQVLFCAVNDAKARLLDPAAPAPQPSIVFDDCAYDVVQRADGAIVFADDGELWVVG